MAVQEGFFRAGDGTELFYRFQPGAPGRKPLLLLHGHGEHSGRYLKFFARLEDLGHPIGIFDLRGCGRSGGPVVYISDFKDYLNDVTNFVDFLKTKLQAPPPVILFGHSLGGLIATAWAKENPGAVSKLILSSPLFGLPNAGPIKLIVKLLDPWASRLVLRNPVYPPSLTHDPGEVEKYRKDPLIRRRITVRLTREMLRWGAFFQEKPSAFPFPVYILAAGDERVVDLKATRAFFERLTAPEKKLEIFPGFFHEIFNESGQDQVFNKLRESLSR